MLHLYQNKYNNAGSMVWYEILFLIAYPVAVLGEIELPVGADGGAENVTSGVEI